MRAKNTVIPGVGSFIFTYNSKNGVFDEIDIEIVGDDANTKPNPHPTGQDGWTDARFNAWANAKESTCKPEVSFKQPIRDAKGAKVSHQDGKFHTYAIEWRKNRIDFFIDGVHQQTITRLVPTHPATLHVGMRHMGWTGKLDWKGTRTMLVDWIRITPLKGERPNKK
jgi:beta-glucanase (GH16 family)